jgi:hypothetical protein
VGVIDLGYTNYKELEEFNESVVYDDDEYQDHELHNSENEDHDLDNSENEDDGIVLDIIG